MIAPETAAEILRLYHAEKWRVNTIASHLHVHHSVVTRILKQEGLPTGEAPRPSMADPFIPFIVETLKRYPRLTATRLHQMVRERGYPGGVDHFRDIVSRYRPRPEPEAYLRLRTLPGEQAQVDWAHFGKLKIGRAERRLVAFVMTLSWSRAIFLRFYLGETLINFLRGHVDAFEHFGGVPRVALYDNLKSAVIERMGDAIRFNPTHLALAAHYRFEPRPVAVARGNEKGRVERAIRYVRDSFYAARAYRDLDDLNGQALAWCNSVAADRPCPEDRSMSVRSAFEQERERLLVLPDTPFPSEDQVEVSVGKTPYVRFDLNDYSVPHTLVRRILAVRATLETVRVLDSNQVVATHPRSFDKGAQIEDPSHIQALVERKREARKHRALDRLHHAVPETRPFLQRLAERGGNLGSATHRLTELLDTHGRDALGRAVEEALARDVIHVPAVRQILDRHLHERGQQPPLPIPLPDDARVRDLIVEHHPLQGYDALVKRPEDNQP